MIGLCALWVKNPMSGPGNNERWRLFSGELFASFLEAEQVLLVVLIRYRSIHPPPAFYALRALVTVDLTRYCQTAGQEIPNPIADYSAG